MKTMTKVAGMTAVGLLAVQALPALAQTAGSQQVEVYAGELFGDDVTDRQISGQTPKMDDDVTFGLRYAYYVTDALGLEASVGHTGNAVKNLPGGDVDLDLTTVDLNAVWNFKNSSRFVPYVLAGIGFASTSLEHDITGTVDGQPVVIRDDDTFTFNAGLGAKYLATDRFYIRAEARYRYLDKVVDRFDTGLNTSEATLGVGWIF